MTRRRYGQVGLNFGQEVGRSEERTGELEAERERRDDAYMADVRRWVAAD